MLSYLGKERQGYGFNHGTQIPVAVAVTVTQIITNNNKNVSDAYTTCDIGLIQAPVRGAHTIDNNNSIGGATPPAIATDSCFEKEKEEIFIFGMFDFSF